MTGTGEQMIDLTYFNPNSQKEADFIASFVARQDTLNFFLKQLSLVQLGQPARHHLIVAPRGFGKTSLLRRIAIGVHSDADLRTRFIPLRFREEQHNVISLDVLWRNCLQSLMEAREDEEAAQAEMDELDAAWVAHAPRQSLTRDEQDGEPAWHALRSRCDALQRRPVLLIDNLDTLLAGLSAQHQWGLRKRLQADDGPVLIAAASRYPEGIHKPYAAFYEFFRIQTLDKLDHHEVFACLRNIAAHRGAAGQQVSSLLDNDPGRVAALNSMAGGNPRTLSVLYGVLESHMSGDVLSQLSAMLDTFTGWYQARTEELPMQARAGFDALALNWDPITAAALGLATGLDTPTVSSQLSRLEKAGYVETVALSRRKTGRRGYQVVERFFNIWYLMRNGPRRAKQSIRFLTTFLQSCFSATERQSMARAALLNRAVDPSYVLALATSLGNKRLRGSLLLHAQEHSIQAGQAGEYKALVNELRSAWRIGGQSEAADPDQSGCQEEVELGSAKAWSSLGSRTAIASSEARAARALFNEALRLSITGPSQQELEVYDELVSRFGAAGESVLRSSVCNALVNKGFRLGALGRSEQAVAVYDEVIQRFGTASENALQEQVAWALVDKAFRFRVLGKSEQALEVCDMVIARYGAVVDISMRSLVALALVNKGNCLMDLDRLDASESVHRLAIERQPAEAGLYNNLGNLLLDFKGDPESARSAYEAGLAVAAEPKIKSLLGANIAYLVALHIDDPVGARGHLTQALVPESSLSMAGRFLLEALLAFDTSHSWDWPRVFAAIGKAVASDDSTVWTDYADDLERLLWHILAKGKGADFKQWMSVGDYPTKYAPLYHAFVAALEGEDHLLQINPETREPAAKIHAGIARRLKLFGNEGGRKPPRVLPA